MSPVSIYFILGLLYLGSRNKTRDEIQQLLQISFSDQQMLQQLQSLKQSKTSDIILTISNAILCQNKWPIQPQYQQMLTHNLGGQVIFFKNANDAVIKTNAWVSQKTNGLVSELINETDVDGSTKFVLVNTVYFKAKWADPFRHGQTFKKKFMGLGGTSNVDMMQKSTHYFYADDQLLRYIQIPYTDPNYALLIGLPRVELTTTNDIVYGLWQLVTQPNKIWQLNFRSSKVNLELPKFKHQQKLELSNQLKGLGIQQLFTPQADLSLISPVDYLYVDKIIHETVVIVDEEGTEAAAATAATMKLLSAFDPDPPIDFIVDHTFYYAIINRQTQTILFNGIYGY
jgi:serine protease inhibitor